MTPEGAVSALRHLVVAGWHGLGMRLGSLPLGMGVDLSGGSGQVSGAGEDDVVGDEDADGADVAACTFDVGNCFHCLGSDTAMRYGCMCARDTQ